MIINIVNDNNNVQSQNEKNIKINPILNKNSQQLKKESKDNINSQNEKISGSTKISKIGIHKHVHSNSDDYNEEKNKKYLEKNDEHKK